jgi:hypothetical protein
MPDLKPIVARTPEDLADALGLQRTAAKEWQFQHALLARLKEIVRRLCVHTRENVTRLS